jgi:hypothetical protein
VLLPNNLYEAIEAIAMIAIEVNAIVNFLFFIFCP